MTSPGFNAQGAKVYFGQTKGANITATAITKANPAVVSATNTLVAGDIVVCASTTGMPEVVGRAFVVTSPSGAAFTLFNEDASAYAAAATAAVFNKWTMTADLGADMFMDASSSGSQNNTLDVTTLTSTFKEYVAGLPDSPKLSFNLYPNPRDATFKWIRSLQKNRTTVPVLVKVPNPDTTATTEARFFWLIGLGFVTNFVEFQLGVDQPYKASAQVQITGGLEIY